MGEQLSMICTAKFGFGVVQYASILFGIIVNNKFPSKSEIEPLSFKKPEPKCNCLSGRIMR